MDMDQATLAFPAPPSASKTATGDMRAAFAQISKMTPRDPLAEQAFLASKAQVLATHPTLSVPARRALAASLPALGGVAPPGGAPVPGGVGYGGFYNDAFKTNWATGTTLYWEIICPTPPGGNINTFLYLTATNRSAKGVEAFISYDGQNSTFFKVFDWAQATTNPWQINIPFANLANYITTESSHGLPYQVLPLMNVTYQTGPGQWNNEVWLLNHGTDPSQWDLIYRYGYAATLADQQTGWVGSWGPIVETFQNLYVGTQAMGALNAQVISRDANQQWGAWHLLGPADSYIRVDNVGFQLLFLDAYYNWAVNS
jgi:hypothetical protein